MIDLLAGIPESDILTRDPSSLFYVGQSFGGREIWLAREDLTRHLFVCGSTGSGKTELLLGMAINSIASGSGLLFVDGKGDVSTFAKIYAAAERMGRLDDVLLVNFSQPPGLGTPLKRMQSHTINPLQDLSADAVVQMVSTLMGESSGIDSMWRARAEAMVTAAIIAAAYLRDAHGEELTFPKLRDLCSLPALIQLHEGEIHPNLPDAVKRPLRAYLDSIPGFSWERALTGKPQSATTLDQHGYLLMQTTRFFSALSDVFHYIFSAGSAQVDMRDVVLNRRIVVVLLPVLEKSPEEIALLGRLVVAVLKNMMASAMATPVEGNWADVVEERPTNCEIPFLVILDEVGHYVTRGMAVMAAQARSLGFCMCFAVQDMESFELAAREEAKAIFANTNTKIFLSQQNPGCRSLADVIPSNARMMSIRKDVEDDLQVRIRIFKDELLSSSYPHSSALSSERRQYLKDEIAKMQSQILQWTESDPYWRLEPAIKMLQPGEFVLVRSGLFLRGRAPYASASLPTPPIVLNRFVDWKPDDEVILRFYGRHERRSTFFDLLRESPVTSLGLSALSIAPVYEQPSLPDTPSDQMSLLRAFDVILGPQTPPVGNPTSNVSLYKLESLEAE